MSQISFASLDFATKKKRTKRERFLAEMDAVVPWAALLALIDPHYPKAGKGRRPYLLEVMLRVYFLQQWYQLSDPGAEEALYDIHSMRVFAGLELDRDAIPDETTILNFRHLLERHDLPKALFDEVTRHLEEHGALLRGGTIMDGEAVNAPLVRACRRTLIAASPSTKNKAGKRDRAMNQSKEGNVGRKFLQQMLFCGSCCLILRAGGSHATAFDRHHQRRAPPAQGQRGFGGAESEGLCDHACTGGCTRNGGVGGACRDPQTPN
jgi:IS5 family transposase